MLANESSSDICSDKLDEYRSSTHSRSTSFLTVVRSTVVANLQIFSRYKVNLVGGLLEVAMLSFVFWLFANALYLKGENFESMTEHDMFLFFLGGLILVVFNSTALWTPVNTVTRDLYNGTLEFLYSTPASRWGYFLGSVVGDGLVKFVFLFLPLWGVLALVSGASFVSLIAMVLVAGLALVALMAFGIIVSLSVILWKNMRGLVGLIGMLFQFLGGLLFPVQIFPEPVQWLAFLLPTTFGYDLVRYFAFDQVWITLLPPLVEVFLLVVYAVLYTLASIYLLRRVEKYAKRNGLHLI